MSRILKNIKGQKYNLAFFIIIIISICSIIYFGSQKEGYHIDELYSYGLANSEYLPFMHFGISGYDVKDWMKEYGAGESFADLFSNLFKDFTILKDADFDFYNTEIYHAYCIAQANSADTYTTTWVPGQDYLNYLAVSESNTFNYASVYYNQRGDVHPPFFYILLHTVCSIFQGSFSKWFGIGLNMVLSIITLFVLYKMSAKHFGDKRIAFAIIATYALSCGFVSTALFIRMYALLTLMVVLCCYVHLEILHADFAINKKLGLALFFSVLGGYYTQYYFVLYAIGIAAIMIILLLLRHKWKSIVSYIGILGSSAIVGIAIWPFSIKHVFSGYRGRESLDVLQNVRFSLYKAEVMFDNVLGNMFGTKQWLFIFLIAVCAVICIFFYRNSISYKKVVLVTLPILGYTFIVGQISPFLTDRYLMCVYPFCCISFVVIADKAVNAILEYVQKKRHLPLDRIRKIAIAMIIIMMVGANNYIIHTPDYLFLGGQDTFKVPENTDCIYVLPNESWNESAEDTCILAQCNRVGVVYESNISVLAEEYYENAGEYLLVVVDNELNMEGVLQQIKQNIPMLDMEEVLRVPSGSAVRILYKNNV